MKPGRLADALGPGGARALVVLAICAAARAVGLLLIAQGLATAIASLAVGDIAIGPASAIAAGGAVLRAIATWAQGVAAARGAITAKTRLRAELAAHLVAAGGGDAADARLATDGVDDLDDYYGTVLPAAVGAVVIPVAVGLRILSVDPVSAIAIAATLPLIPLFMVLIGMHTRERTDRAQSSLDRLAAHLVELAHGLPVLVGLGRVAEQTEALRRIQDDHRLRTQQTLRTAFLSALALELLATLSVAVVAVLLGVRLLSGDVTLGAALIALLLAPECFASLRDLGAAFHSSEDGRAALRRIRETLARPVRTASRRIGAAAVDGLTVRYAGRAHAALGPVSAGFPSGTVTAVTGASGAGKSTLLAALVGTLGESAQLSGAVRGIRPGLVAYAPQAVHLAADSVRGELALYGEDADAIDRMVHALALDQVLGRSAAQLSPGELRRVAVARALLRASSGATLLVLDEPTAHLDAAAAGAVRDAIRAASRPGLAVVLVSHDPATRAVADRVLTLDASPADTAPTGPAAADAPAAPDGAAPVPRAATAPLRSPGALGTLAGLLAPSSARWAAAVLVGITSAGFGLALTAVSGWLIVRAGSQPAIMYLLVAIVGVRFFGIARSVTRYAERLLTHDAAFDLAGRLRLRLWSAIASRGAGSRQLLEGGSALDYLVSSTDRIRDLLPRVLAPLAVGILTVAGAAVTTALVAPSLAGAVTAGLVATSAVALVAATLREAHNQRSRVATGGELVRRMAALAEAAPDLLANGVGARAVERVGELGEALATAERRTAWTTGLASAIVIAGTGLLAAWVPVGSGASVSAELVAVVSLLLLATAEPVGGAVLAAQRLPGLLEAAGRLGPLLREPYSAPGSGTRALDAVHRLELDDVGVTWPGSAAAVFDPVTIRAGHGDWIVIDGRSGAGKSTLLTAVMGAIPLSDGSISADGLPIDTVLPGDWRRRVAWCPQEAHVFDSTLRGNLLLARPRDTAVTDGEMIDVLRRVGLGPLLEDLANGLASSVGRSGRSLSGGERQRLAVARALLADADILLLDEPTAHLDQPTADAMMRDIRAASADRIVVLVSHRASDRRITDRLVRLSHGTLVPDVISGASLA